jgi:hypothetical protein
MNLSGITVHLKFLKFEMLRYFFTILDLLINTKLLRYTH